MTDAATDWRTVPGRRVSLGAPLALGGGALIAVALAGDLLTAAQQQGFGLYQTILALLGFAVAAQGIELVSSRGAQHLTELRAMVTGVHVGTLLRFGAVAGQVGLFWLVARLFQVENPAFYDRIVPLVAVGFVVHHLLPSKHRMPFFVALSLAGLLLVLGPVNAAWVAGIAGLFIALTRIPLAFGPKVGVIVLVAGALAVMRGMNIGTPWSAALWPVLGSMLMFRLIVLLYDQRHATEPVRLREVLAYIFLLPNVVFPLFPVVDFATFRRTYYDRDAYLIYQEGLRWIFRGLTHLLLYRLIYQYGTIAPSEVVTTSDLVRYMLATFGLYLRVSGQFHLVVGILHLFGFRLPETHRLFYLAASFTDFWRRINIYWKDFMMKLVFYPLYFPLRKKRGETAALVIGTFAVFLVTWVTHSYQWFWIMGSWLLSWTDGLFWAILAVLLLGNSLRELKHGRRRVVGARPVTARESLGVGLRTATTFAVICVLWSLWGSASLGEWFDLLTVSQPRLAEVAMIVGVLATVGVAGALAERWERRVADGRAAGPRAFARSALATAVGFGLLYVAGSPTGLSHAGPRVQEIVRELRFPELNARDAARLTRGYYENLTGIGQQNNQLWELYAQRLGDNVSIWHSGVLRERDDFLAQEMVPFFGVYQHGIAFRTNRWGMRDRDYALVPPANGFRIALLGQSYIAGDGVSDGESFEELAEERSNRDSGPGGAPRVEILNFAVGSYSVLQQALILDRVFSFGPRVLVLFVGPGDEQRAALHLVEQLRRGVPPPFPHAAVILSRAGVDGSLREAEALARLQPYMAELVDGAYRLIAAACRARGVRPVWAYLAVPDRRPKPETVAAMAARARATGFETIDFSDVYDGRDMATLRVSRWDFHPNGEAHRLIAERFYRELRDNPAFARLP